MRFVHNSRLFLLTGFVALFAFGGDLVVDAVCDVEGHPCKQTSQTSSQGDCTGCDCAVHCGAALFAESDGLSLLSLTVVDFSPAEDFQAINALPAAIDHPPQLG